MNDIANLTVFLVEDHPVMRLGLKMMLEEKGVIICGEASSIIEAVNLIPASVPDMAIFDLSLNGENAFAALEQIRRLLPKIGLPKTRIISRQLD